MYCVLLWSPQFGGGGASKTKTEFRDEAEFPNKIWRKDKKSLYLSRSRNLTKIYGVHTAHGRFLGRGRSLPLKRSTYITELHKK